MAPPHVRAGPRAERARRAGSALRRLALLAHLYPPLQHVAGAPGALHLLRSTPAPRSGRLNAAVLLAQFTINTQRTAGLGSMRSRPRWQPAPTPPSQQRRPAAPAPLLRPRARRARPGPARAARLRKRDAVLGARRELGRRQRDARVQVERVRDGRARAAERVAQDGRVGRRVAAGQVRHRARRDAQALRVQPARTARAPASGAGRARRTRRAWGARPDALRRQAEEADAAPAYERCGAGGAVAAAFHAQGAHGRRGRSQGGRRWTGERVGG